MVRQQETEKRLVCLDLEEIAGFAQQLLRIGAHHRIWLFEGELGAGKTTFIKAICQILGVTDTVSSPTYSLINEYIDGDSNLLYHFDFYRIRDLHEAIDIGAEEYFYSGAYCFIEWGSKVTALLPDLFFKVRIKVRSDGTRELLTTKHE